MPGKPHNWTKDQLERIRFRLLRGDSASGISREMGCSIGTINRVAETLGIIPKTKLWKPEEDKILLEGLSEGLPNTQIAKRLGRPASAVGARMKILNLPKRLNWWMPEEESVLLEYYEKGLSRKEIGDLLGRTPLSLAGRLSRLRNHGVFVPNVVRVLWSEEEDAVLREMIDQGLTDSQISNRLGRSKASVSHRRNELGLRKRFIGRGWTSEEDERLRYLEAGGTKRAQISKIMGRTLNEVAYRRLVLGIKSKKWADAKERRALGIGKCCKCGDLYRPTERERSSSGRMMICPPCKTVWLRERSRKIKNLPRVLNYVRRKSKQVVKEMTDSYIRGLIYHGGIGVLRKEDIPQELIELVRVNLLIKRAVKQQEQTRETT